MRLTWRRSSDDEDRFEEWIAGKHQDRVLAGETSQRGPCPQDSFLHDLARRSRNISLSDPRVDHAATCPTCMSRLLALREEQRLRRNRVIVAAAAASCAILVIALLWSTRALRRDAPQVNTLATSRTVDLWSAETVRGEQPGQLEAVVLPAALVQLTIVLPEHSEPGQYLIAITRDRNGNGVVAEGLAATAGGEREQLRTSLDLRKAQPGEYFLSTTHEHDQTAYYYPLRIHR